MDETAAVDTEKRLARAWLAVAIGSLVLAGVLALLLVVGRMPPLDLLFHDPLFFRRCLVVHVDLSLLVWFHAFTAGLVAAVPARRPAHALARRAPLVTSLGIALLVASAAATGSTPVLSNYVPAIDHPVFLVGLGLVAAGVLASLLDVRLLPREERPGSDLLPPASRVGLRAAGLAFTFAVLTLGASAFANAPDLPADTRYELLFWGAGHVLQFASVAAMLAAWMALLASALGREPIGRRAATWLFALLVLPVAGAPLLALGGTGTVRYHAGFTRLMELGIFPVTTVILVACVAALARARREGRLPAAGLRDGRVMGFLASAALTLVGFALGALVHGSNTIVPGHYHASIGAVTAAFMALTYVLLPRLGLSTSGASARARAAAAWQPVLFGIGQLVFAVGFSLAGANGMARKVYGTEQVRSHAETAGLLVMGIGGIVAVAGGLLFLVLATTAWRRALAETSARTWRLAWMEHPAPSTPSRN